MLVPKAVAAKLSRSEMLGRRSVLRVGMALARTCNAGFSRSCRERSGRGTCFTYLCSRSNCPPATFGQYSRNNATAMREFNIHQYAVNMSRTVSLLLPAANMSVGIHALAWTTAKQIGRAHV